LNRRLEAAIDRPPIGRPHIVRCLVYCDLTVARDQRSVRFEGGDRVLAGRCALLGRSEMPMWKPGERLAGDRSSRCSRTARFTRPALADRSARPSSWAGARSGTGVQTGEIA